MEIYLKVCFSFLVHLAIHLSIAGADFSTQPDSQEQTCVDIELPLNWEINNDASINNVVWSFDGVAFALKVGSSGTPTYTGSIITAAKVEYTTSGNIVIKNPVVADSGEYSCRVAYTGPSGFAAASSTATVTVDKAPSNPTCTHTGNTYTCATDSTSATVTIKIDTVDQGTNTYTGSVKTSVECCLSGYAVQCRDDTSDTTYCKFMQSCSPPGTTVSPSTTTTTPGTTATNTTSGPTKNTTSGPTNHIEGSTTNTISSTTASPGSLSVSVIIAISAGGGLVILVGITIAITCHCKRKSKTKETIDDKHSRGIDNQGIYLQEHSNRDHHL